MAKTVRDIMSAEVTTLGRNDTLLLAKDIMNLGRIRHFPVVEDDELVGVVSQRDLYRASLGTVMQYGEKAQRAFPGERRGQRDHGRSDFHRPGRNGSGRRPADDGAQNWLPACLGRRPAGWHCDRDRYATSHGRYGLRAVD